MSYIDGFIVPVPEGKEEYRSLAQKMAGKFTDQGALQVIEAWGDDVTRGKTTDFFMAVKAEDGEKCRLLLCPMAVEGSPRHGLAEDHGRPRNAARRAADAVRRQAHVLGRIPADRRGTCDGARLIKTNSSTQP